MPTFIKTKKDEARWEKAKALAKDQGQAENWAYITGIYKRMNGGKVADLALRYLFDQDRLRTASIVSPDNYLYTETGEYVWSIDRVKEAWRKAYARLDRLIASGHFTKLVLLVGLPASGKSTWLKSNHERDAIYFDATLTIAQHRVPLIQKAKNAGLTVWAVVMDTPIAVCLDRNRCRTPDRMVPEATIERMQAQLAGSPPRESEGIDKIVHVRGKQAAQGSDLEIADRFTYRGYDYRVTGFIRLYNKGFEYVKPKDAQFVMGYSIAGVIAPVRDVQGRGPVKWSPEQIVAEKAQYEKTLLGKKTSFFLSGLSDETVAWMRSKIAKTNVKVVEVPNTFHQVKVEPPKAKRKEFPFQGFIDFQGLQIDVENVKGSVREGKGWKSEMFFHYGEIRNTEGVDGDKLDVYVGDNHDSSIVVVIHQHDPESGKYDEDKVMLGFGSVEEAIGAYKKQYSHPGFYREGEYTAIPIGNFWRWCRDERNRGKKVKVSFLSKLASEVVAALSHWVAVPRLDAAVLRGADMVKWVRITPTGRMGEVVAQKALRGWNIQVLRPGGVFDPQKAKPATERALLKLFGDSGSNPAILKNPPPPDSEKILRDVLSQSVKALQKYLDDIPKEWKVESWVRSEYKGKANPGSENFEGSLAFFVSPPRGTSPAVTLSARIFVKPVQGQIRFGVYSDNHYLDGNQFPLGETRKVVDTLVSKFRMHSDPKLRGAEREYQKQKAAPPGLNSNDVTNFLKQLQTRKGGRIVRVHKEQGFWSAEPAHRQRLDHYVGGFDFRDPDDDMYDPEGWNSDAWEEEYSEPLRREVVEKLNSRFGKGLFTVDIDDKGFINVYLTAQGEKTLKTAGQKPTLTKLDQSFGKGAFKVVVTEKGFVEVARSPGKTAADEVIRLMEAALLNDPDQVPPVGSRLVGVDSDPSWGAADLRFDTGDSLVIHLSDQEPAPYKTVVPVSGVDIASRILALLRALSWNYLTSHWQVGGDSSYGDHLLFQRMYETTQEEIDTLAEKIVGTYGMAAVDARKQAEEMSHQLNQWDIGCPFERGLTAEKTFQVALQSGLSTLEEKGDLSLGMDNLLRTLADTHETHMYLLQQRQGGSRIARVVDDFDRERAFAARTAIKWAAQVITDTATIYAIAPEQLKELIEGDRWLDYWIDKSWERADEVVQEHGGAVFHTGADGTWDVEVPGRQ